MSKVSGEMKRFPGVGKRRGSNLWQWAIKAPKDLRGQYRTQWAHRCSLDTADLREANARASRLHAEWIERFEAQRRSLNAARVETLTPEQVEVLAQRVRAAVLRDDDAVRENPEAARVLLLIRHAARNAGRRRFPAGRLRFFTDAHEPLPAAPTPDHLKEDSSWSPLSGLSPAVLEEFAEVNAALDGDAAIDLARRNVAAAIPLADREARLLGWAVEWARPEMRGALAACLGAYRQARREVTQRDRGEVIETPKAPPVPVSAAIPEPAPEPAPANARTLRHVFDSWRDAEPNRPRKTVDAYEDAADRFESLMGNRPVQSLTRPDGVKLVSELKRWADEHGKSRTTAAHILGRLKTLLNHAADIEWISSNPLQGRSIEKARSERRPWSDEDLVRLFDAPLFAAYALPGVARAGKDAAYWLPLLGLFTGARISELAQLWTDDVEDTPDAGLVFALRARKGRGQALKNRASERRIPVHAELIRLGFDEYWRAIAAHGPGRMWPALPRSDSNGAGGKVSQWFGEFKTAQGFGTELTFHSFRHTVRTRLAAKGAPESHIDAMIGHAGGSEGRQTYTQLTPADVRSSLATLVYPGLVLPRVFTAPAWRPKAR